VKYPKFAGNVKALGYHYNHNAETYLETGLRHGWAMADLLKAETK
jgi:hypothetical protein